MNQDDQTPARTTLPGEAIKPLPCPYCGYVLEAEIYFTDLQMNEDYCWVGCANQDCYAAGPPTYMEIDDTEEETVAKAITAWNCRPIEDEMRADIERRQRKLDDCRLEMQGLLADRAAAASREQALQQRITELEKELSDMTVWGQACDDMRLDLEETLAFAAQYKGIEGRLCPLCKYEDGVFIEACQMHKDMDEARRLAAEASEWQPLPDGSYEDFTLTDNGKRVVVFISQEWGDESFRLDDDMRLQRRFVATSEATGGDDE